MKNQLKWILCMLFAGAIYSQAQARAQTESNLSQTIVIEQKCNSANTECAIHYRNLKGRGEIISDIPAEVISISWLNDQRLSNIHVNCGSYCSADFYLKENTKPVTFSDVLALDTRHECVLYAKDMEHIVFQKVFSPRPAKTINIQSPQYNFAEMTAIGMLAENDTPYFDEQGDFKMDYEAANGQTKTLRFNKPCDWKREGTETQKFEYLQSE